MTFRAALSNLRPKLQDFQVTAVRGNYFQQPLSSNTTVHAFLQQRRMHHAAHAVERLLHHFQAGAISDCWLPQRLARRLCPIKKLLLKELSSLRVNRTRTCSRHAVQLGCHATSLPQQPPLLPPQVRNGSRGRCSRYNAFPAIVNGRNGSLYAR